MKRINILIVITAIAIFASCSKPHVPTLCERTNAKGRLMPLFSSHLKDATLTPRDTIVEYDGDSVCIIRSVIDLILGKTENTVEVEYCIMWTFANDSTPPRLVEHVDIFHEVGDDRYSFMRGFSSNCNRERDSVIRERAMEDMRTSYHDNWTEVKLP